MYPLLIVYEIVVRQESCLRTSVWTMCARFSRISSTMPKMSTVSCSFMCCSIRSTTMNVPVRPTPALIKSKHNISNRKSVKISMMGFCTKTTMFIQGHFSCMWQPIDVICFQQSYLLNNKHNFLEYCCQLYIRIMILGKTIINNQIIEFLRNNRSQRWLTLRVGASSKFAH